jgi:hypothetical protein
MGNTEFSNLSAYIPEEVVGLFHMRKLKGLARLKHDVIPSSFVTKGSSQKRKGPHEQDLHGVRLLHVTRIHSSVR